MNIIEFFNPYDVNHLKAFKQLQETGSWPEGFVPKGTTFPATWNYSIISILADAWIRWNLELEASFNSWT